MTRGPESSGPEFTHSFRHDLAELASAHGVSPVLEGRDGVQREVASETLVRILAALDVEASTHEAVRRALQEHELKEWVRPLPPCVVIRQAVPANVRISVPVMSEPAAHILLEDGTTFPLEIDFSKRRTRKVHNREIASAHVRIPATLPLGWHRLRMPFADSVAESTLIVVPQTVSIDPPRALGVMAQLYQVRSRRSWGLGDFGDLATLADWSGKHLGADFLLINPVHAGEPAPPLTPSPYSPVTRRFFSPLYLRIEAIPEYASLPAHERQEIESAATPLVRSGVQPGDLIDRDRVWRVKINSLTRIFQQGRSRERQEELKAYEAGEGDELDLFATWCAIAETHGPDWNSWPSALRDSSSAAVREYRERHSDRIGFFRWVQWITESQLTDAQRSARQSGLRIGIVNDLAVGVSRTNAETWMYPGLFASYISVGAPADSYNANGQNWGQSPWRPDTLAEAGYRPFGALIRTLLRTSGGLRIDHVKGLFRSWWIPEGMRPADGTYVRQDSEALLGILCLEAVRAGAVVIGEDVSPRDTQLREELAARRIFGTSILWFERDSDRKYADAKSWRERCLATVGTHDLPPTRTYLDGSHLRAMSRLGMLSSSEQESTAVHQRHMRDLHEAVTASSGSADVGESADAENARATALTVELLYQHLGRTSAKLLGIQLCDLVGERRSINFPGTDTEYPNWRLFLEDAKGRPVFLEELAVPAWAVELAETYFPRGGACST